MYSTSTSCRRRQGSGQFSDRDSALAPRLDTGDNRCDGHMYEEGKLKNEVLPETTPMLASVGFKAIFAGLFY